jgi:5-methylcytosine-specific restriction protein A
MKPLESPRSEGFLYAAEVLPMPSKPKRPCGHPGCPNLTDGYFCPAHTKAEQKRYNRYDRNPESNRRYGRAWKKIRAAFLAANPLCEICQKTGRLTPATLAHHKKPLAEGGTNSFDNLTALCTECHSRLHAEQGDRW